MKSMLNMMSQPQMQNSQVATAAANYAAGSSYAAENSAQPAVNTQDLSILTTRIQSFLNSGGQALAIAEAKTAQVAKMQESSAEYKRMVEEVKAFQARASYDFRQAESLLATANSLMPKKK